MKVLALEPYYGGSHKAFLEGWISRSRHDWTMLTLPPYKWKWRMRHSAVTFAEQAKELKEKGEAWDIIFCSDMLNLAEFLGLSPFLADIPTVAYFHENQLTYPVQCEDERDYQFAMTNFTTALSATGVWFNSDFHLESFLNALRIFFKKMPDHQPADTIEIIRAKSRVFPPCTAPLPQRQARKPGAMRILWAARWEHDKNPEDFFAALKILKDRNTEFIIDIIGEQFRNSPGIFNEAKNIFSKNINRWGYLSTRGEYEQALLEADIFVSTADHEFFGISAVEAITAGAYPLLPNRLSYPEILQLKSNPDSEKYFYDGSVEGLAEKLMELSQIIIHKEQPDTRLAQKLTERFCRDKLVRGYDDEMEQLITIRNRSRTKCAF